MKILNKKVLVNASGTKITQLEVSAPLIAQKAQPGQFVVVMISEVAERIPLTVVDKNVEAGSITLIVQELGYSTKLIGQLEPGSSLYAIVGPMGHATKIINYGKVILIGGGVGIAEIYPVARALKKAGNEVTTILGARTKDLLVLEEEMKTASSNTYITTDDGSYERKGFVTQVLDELLNKETYNFVYAVGPIPMMERVSEVTKKYNVKTMVSLNALMVDATGMCGGCRVQVGDEVKFSCIDGPEFDGHLVDWDGLKKRNRVYIEKEKHICNLNKL